MSSEKLEFEAKSNGEQYGFAIELFDKVQDKPVKVNQTGKGLSLTLLKSTPKAEYWPRLQKEKTKLPYVTVDWSKWVDEDEQEDVVEEGNPMEGLDMSGMGGMGGMGGPGGPGGNQMDLQAMMQQLGQNAGGDQPDEESDDEENTV